VFSDKCLLTALQLISNVADAAKGPAVETDGGVGGKDCWTDGLAPEFQPSTANNRRQHKTPIVVGTPHEWVVSLGSCPKIVMEPPKCREILA